MNLATMAARPRLLPVLLSLLLGPSVARPAQDDPRRAQEIYRRAVAYEKQANYGAALPLLWEAAGLAPRNPGVQKRLGEALDRIGGSRRQPRRIAGHPPSGRTSGKPPTT